MEKTINLELTLGETDTLYDLLYNINIYDIRASLAKYHKWNDDEDISYVSSDVLISSANNISNIYKKIRRIKYE